MSENDTSSPVFQENNQVKTPGKPSDLMETKQPVKYAYKPARLSYHMVKGQRRYYIEYHAFRPDYPGSETGQLVRLRKAFDLNQQPTATDRNARARAYIAHINKQLKENMHLPPRKQKKSQLMGQLSPNKLTIYQAFKQAIEIKLKYSGLKENTKKNYRSAETVFLSWLQKNKLDQLPIGKLTTQHLQAFFNYLIDTRKAANKTYNNYRGTLGALLSTIIRQNKKLFEENPLEPIKKLRVKATKHAAMSAEQIKRAIAFFQADPEREYMALVVQFIYFTLARPNEIRNIKVSDIDLEKNQLTIAAETSKTDLGYCGIPQVLGELIKKSGLLEAPAQYYIFGNEKKPGPTPYHVDTFYQRNKHMLEKTGINQEGKNYSLYSYKHSGAISLYTATKDIKLLQRQMRHKSIEQTSAYLRDLGLTQSFEGLKDWTGGL